MHDSIVSNRLSGIGLRNGSKKWDDLSEKKVFELSNGLDEERSIVVEDFEEGEGDSSLWS